MKMIEKVARSIYANQPQVRTTDTGDGNETIVIDYKPTAIAALQAFREPTAEMWAAAWLVYHPWGVNAPDPGDRPNAFDAMKEKTSAILAAMIDKAIQESGE